MSNLPSRSTAPEPALAEAGATAEEIGLEVRGLGKSFPGKDGERTTTIFENVSFELPPGDFLTIVGASGSGKSTLLQILAGLQTPTEGELLYGRHKVDKPTRDIIYVFQDYSKSIFPWLTIRQNVAFGLQARKERSKQEAYLEAERFIELVGLGGYESYHPKELSGGMQQRVALARALACEPAVLLMDEPFSAVDAFTRAMLQDLILRLWETLSLSVVFVTHDVDEAVFLSTRVAILEGSPATISGLLSIDLEYPRNQLATRESKSYLGYRHTIFTRIMASSGREGAT